MLDGNYAAVTDAEGNEFLTVMSGPAATIAKLRVIQAALQRARAAAAENDVEAAVAEVARVSPETAQFIREWWGRLSVQQQGVAMQAVGVGATVLVGLLMATIAIIGQVMAERRATQGEVTEERVRVIVEEEMCKLSPSNPNGIPPKTADESNDEPDCGGRVGQ